jgi:hypothetical protein
MKNYIAVFGVPVTTSFLAPKTIGGVTSDEAQLLTDQYLAADPGATQDGPPARFYWLLNKLVISAIYVSQTDSFDPFHNPQFTQDPDVANDYSVDSDLAGFGWGGTDTQDPKQVSAAKIAETTIKNNKSGKGTKTVAPETLLHSLLTFAGALVAAGYKTGGRPNLLTRLIVFITAVKNNQPYDAAALGVLLSQIESLAHFAG